MSKINLTQSDSVEDFNPYQSGLSKLNFQYVLFRPRIDSDSSVLKIWLLSTETRFDLD